MARAVVNLIEKHAGHSTVASCEVPRLLPAAVDYLRPFPASLTVGSITPQ